MKLSFVISAGIHAIVAGAFIISSWNATFSRQTGMVRPGYRQVSLVSGGAPGRQRQLIPKKESAPKSEKSVPDEKVEKSSSLETTNTGTGKGEVKHGGISTGIATDGAFPHGYYLELVEKKIEAMFVPPTKAPGLETDIHFSIDRTGRATNLKVQKQSGNALFDQAGMRAILSANPLPPLPADFGASSLGILYIFKAE